MAKNDEYACISAPKARLAQVGDFRGQPRALLEFGDERSRSVVNMPLPDRDAAAALAAYLYQPVQIQMVLGGEEPFRAAFRETLKSITQLRDRAVVARNELRQKGAQGVSKDEGAKLASQEALYDAEINTFNTVLKVAHEALAVAGVGINLTKTPGEK